MNAYNNETRIFDYEEAIEILRRYVRVYEENLRRKTLHGTVLGQFWEIALQEIIEEYVLPHLNQEFIVASGAIAQDPPVNKGQCDILILPQSSRENGDFFVGNLAVVQSNVAPAVIEVKYPAEGRDALVDALKQVQNIKDMSPQTKVYLFIVSAMTEESTVETAESWLSEENNNRELPNAIVLFSRSRVFVPYSNEDGTVKLRDEFQDLERGASQLESVRFNAGLPYNEIEEYTEEIRQRGANLLYFFEKLVKDLNANI